MERESTELGKLPWLRARVGPPEFQMSYFFNYDLCRILLNSFKIDSRGRVEKRKTN